MAIETAQPVSSGMLAPILEAVRAELVDCPQAVVAARGGTLVVILKLDRHGAPKQIQVKVDRPRTSVTVLTRSI